MGGCCSSPASALAVDGGVQAPVPMQRASESITSPATDVSSKPGEDKRIVDRKYVHNGTSSYGNEAREAAIKRYEANKAPKIEKKAKKTQKMLKALEGISAREKEIEDINARKRKARDGEKSLEISEDVTKDVGLL